jgi:hypothetical protein
MPRKKFKFTRFTLHGDYPKTKKEKDNLYRFLEATGTIRKMLNAREVIIKEEVKS